MKILINIAMLSLLMFACGDSSGDSNNNQPINPAPVTENGDQGLEDTQFFATDGIAIRGYDPVAYFNDGQALAGDESISHDWMGVTWLFSSEENLESFVSDPEAFAPQYGGYCAYAVSQGYIASIDPNAWNIVDGKLYLNLSLSVKNLWEKDIPGHISRANANWPAVLNN